MTASGLPRKLYEKLVRAYWARRQGPVLLAPRKGQKRALLSYIVTPFAPTAKILHCNHVEAVGMADVLREEGYDVDVMDYRSDRDIDFSRYDLVIGFGRPFVKSFSQMNYSGHRILYMTGACPDFSNRAEAFRLHALRQRKGLLLQPRRVVEWSWTNPAINADGFIATGNHWTASTYDGLGVPVASVPVPHITPEGASGQAGALSGCGRDFIWFSGAGAVHKGLDLVLEAMDNAPDDWHLHVCGPIANEHDFLQLYRPYLYGNPKISYWGFIDPAGQCFRDIIRKSAFVIFPSCSEGGASSVITCMADGLIPLVTVEASVDVGSEGFIIRTASPEGVHAAMLEAAALSSDEVSRRAEKIKRMVREKNSPQAYRRAFRSALSHVVPPESDKEKG